MTRFLAMALVVLLGYILSDTLDRVPQDGLNPTAEAYVRDGMEETGAMNIVASIYLGYRVYDTLGEAIVLFTSAMGVGLMLKRKGGSES